jgi:hypothetical protein
MPFDLDECECGHIYDEHEDGGQCYGSDISVFGDPDGRDCGCTLFEAVAGSATPTTEAHAVHGFTGNVTRLGVAEPGSATPTEDDDG